MKKIYYTWQQVEGACLDLCRQMVQDKWYPDYIVGISRGGLVPANLISQYLDIPMATLMVSLRDGGIKVSDCGMSEDAYNGQNILVVDDINDQGSTIAWIKQDWQSSCLPGETQWQKVWGQNVRFATLTNNLDSKEDVDYAYWEVNKAEEDCWLVYPWEEFWK
jgi:xanthine phosphoribosyltransferase